MSHRHDNVSNSDDILDSRDVIARIAELEAEKEDFEHDEDGNKTEADWAEANANEAEELKALQSLTEEAEGYAPDWQHGTTLIRRSYFVDYCRELVSDIGDMPRDIPGYLVIDWEATASNLEVDYTTVDFDGVEYLVR